MNIAQLLVRAATTCPERPAIVHGDRVLWDYRSFARRASAIAAGLRYSLGLTPGDRVAVFMTNNPEYLEILYAIWWAGMVAVPVNAKLHPRELAFVLGDAEASCLFISDDFASSAIPLIEGIPTLRKMLIPGTADYHALLQSEPMSLTHRAPEDPAWLFYTSGTTGNPKGVIETHRNLWSRPVATQ